MEDLFNMNDDKTNKYKLDQTKLTPEQRDRLDSYNQATSQIKALKDIADMTQAIYEALDGQTTDSGKSTKEMGVLLLDIRDSLATLSSKKDSSDTEVVNAVHKLETAITSAVKSIDVKPTVQVDAPSVTVTPTPVDLKNIEKLLKTDLPAAFRDAVGLIPAPEKDDYSSLLSAWEGISEQLVSIENATRMKPLPGTMKVTNPNGTTVGGSTAVTSLVPGTTATSLGKAEDSAHTTGDTGVMALAVRNDGGAVQAGTDGDYVPLTTDATGALRIDLNGTVSTNNSTTTPLAGNAAFTGTSEDVLNYNEIRITVIASHASANDGLSIQQSSDNTNWDITDTYTIPATTSKTYSVPRQARYFRVVYTNGVTLQTSLRIQTVLNRQGARVSSQRPNDGYSNETDLEQTQAFNMVYNNTTWDRHRGDTIAGAWVNVKGGSIPSGTTLTNYSVRITSNTTTTPIASTAYISSITITTEVGGTTSTVTIKDKQGTPLVLVNGLTTTAASLSPTVINFQTPVKMTSGIDVITAGAVAGTVDIWVNYYA